MSTHSPAEVRNLLRDVGYPGFAKDIVSAGFVKGLAVSGETAIIDFAPNSSNGEKVRAMEAGIRERLARAGFQDIRVMTALPFKDADMALRQPIAADGDSDHDINRGLTGPGVMTPLQAELQEDGIIGDPDLLHDDLRRQEQPPGVGLGGDMPEPLPGPEGPPGDSYDGALPVFQWDIDPHDSAADNHESGVRLRDWEIRVWWQVHPAGDLVYASLQAMRDDWADRDGTARTHPVGRSAAVNLVFDMRRQGVVAIYGTVRDFRPFVEAFHQAWATRSESPQEEALQTEERV